MVRNEEHIDEMCIALEDQKESEYDQEIPQSHTADQGNNRVIGFLH